MNKPLLVGITGGIGSGKSIVCRVFQLFDIPVYEADSRAKWLMNHNPQLIQAIKENFGAKSYDQNNQLNRAYLAAQVFNDSQKVEILNRLVHPQVGQDFQDWVAKNASSPYILNEAALIFESGRFKTLDKVITVFAPEEIRITRVAQRDRHRSPEQIKAIIQKQMPESEKLARADHIIYNDEQQLIIPQVIQLHKTFLTRPNNI